MNIQILPHIFKKIGLFLFIAYPVGHALLGFLSRGRIGQTNSFRIYEHCFSIKHRDTIAIINYFY